MKIPQNAADLQVPAGEELDGIGKWLMKIAQSLAKQYRLPLDDVYQDCVLQYLKRRHYYSVERGARSTFASLAAGRTLRTVYSRQKSARAGNGLTVDVAVTETREARRIPDAAYAAAELPWGNSRKAAFAKALQEAGWSEKEIEEISISTVSKVKTRVLCSHGS